MSSTVNSFPREKLHDPQNGSGAEDGTALK
jgi:hypothetical protein